VDFVQASLVSPLGPRDLPGPIRRQGGSLSTGEMATPEKMLGGRPTQHGITPQETGGAPKSYPCPEMWGHAQSGSTDGKGDLPTAAGASTPSTRDAQLETTRADQTPQGRHERPPSEADSDTDEVTDELLGHLPIGNSRDSIPLYTLEVQDFESGEPYEVVTLAQSLDALSTETPQAPDCPLIHRAAIVRYAIPRVAHMSGSRRQTVAQSMVPPLP
jgi:hypothetical protein